MDPYIGGIFDSLFDWQCLMECAIIFLIGVLIQYRWPNQCPPLYGCHGQIVVAGKVRFTTTFDCIEVQKDCHESNSRLFGQVYGIVVTVFAIEFAYFIFQQLKVFRVLMGDAQQGFNFRIDSFHHWVLGTVSLAPGMFGRASTTRSVTDKVNRIQISLFCPKGNQSIRFFLGQEVIQGNDPRSIVNTICATRFGKGRDIVFGELWVCRDSFEDFTEITRLLESHGDGRVKWTTSFIVQHVTVSGERRKKGERE